jgi:hypothetical protein
VTLANLVAEGEVFALQFDGMRIVVIGEKNFVYRTAGGDGASDDEFDEITTGMKHGRVLLKSFLRG